MKNVKIKLTTIDSIKDFVSKTNKLDCCASLTIGQYTVDAKSIMGILSLDLSQKLDLLIFSDNCKDFMDSITCYVV